MSVTIGDVYMEFQSLAKKKRQADALVMELMYSPQAQAEHLVSAHRIAVNIDEEMSKVVTALRKKWDARQQVITTPWNNSEFDRYDRRFIKETKDEQD